MGFAADKLLRAGFTAKEFGYVTSSGTRVSYTNAVTFSSMDIGDADADRYVIVVAHWAEGLSAFTNLSSVSIGGSAATKIAAAASGAAAQGTGIWYRKVTSGTTANISLAFSGSAQTFGVGVYRLISTAGAIVSDADAAIDTGTATVGSDEGGNALISAATCFADPAPTITGGAQQDYSFDPGASGAVLSGYSRFANVTTQSITGNGLDTGLSIAAFLFE